MPCGRATCRPTPTRAPPRSPCVAGPRPVPPYRADWGRGTLSSGCGGRDPPGRPPLPTRCDRTPASSKSARSQAPWPVGPLSTDGRGQEWRRRPTTTCRVFRATRAGRRRTRGPPAPTSTRPAACAAPSAISAPPATAAPPLPAQGRAAWTDRTALAPSRAEPRETRACRAVHIRPHRVETRRCGRAGTGAVPSTLTPQRQARLVATTTTPRASAHATRDPLDPHRAGIWVPHRAGIWGPHRAGIWGPHRAGTWHPGHSAAGGPSRRCPRASRRSKGPAGPFGSSLLLCICVSPVLFLSYALLWPVEGRSSWTSETFRGSLLASSAGP